MAKAATSEELKEAFTSHLEETKGHVERLDQIFEMLEKSSRGKTCKGMQGLIEEGSEMIEEDAEDDVKDAGIISAAQRVEHYEIAGYGTVVTYAKLLKMDEAADLLEQTLQEEKAADKKLTALSESINVQANRAEAA
jgi:ferritin-like metal-binding protein YciE